MWEFLKSIPTGWWLLAVFVGGFITYIVVDQLRSRREAKAAKDAAITSTNSLLR